jgi:hypothetical protein
VYCKIFRPFVRLLKINRNIELGRISKTINKSLDKRVPIYLKMPLFARTDAAKKDKLVAKSIEIYNAVKQFRISVGLEID